MKALDLEEKRSPLASLTRPRLRCDWIRGEKWYILNIHRKIAFVVFGEHRIDAEVVHKSLFESVTDAFVCIFGKRMELDFVLLSGDLAMTIIGIVLHVGRIV